LSPVTESNQAFISQFCAGSKEAFEQLVLRHKDRVYTLACRLLGDHGEAEDVAQETFLRAYERLADFRGDARFSTWLYRICYNLCVNRFQRKKRDPGNDSTPDGVPHSTSESCDQLLVKEQQHLLNWALSRLNAELREVVLLYHTDHLSYEEIASVLGYPIGTVRSRLHRARGELKRILHPYFAEA
jgi:RNA polymerase sigma-70 factor (ECF subfamily)